MAVGLTVAPATAASAEPAATPPSTSRSWRRRRGLLRLVSFLVTVVLASLLTFGLLKLIPGDPAIVIAGENATPRG